MMGLRATAGGFIQYGVKLSWINIIYEKKMKEFADTTVHLLYSLIYFIEVEITEM